MNIVGKSSDYNRAEITTNIGQGPGNAQEFPHIEVGVVGEPDGEVHV